MERKEQNRVIFLGISLLILLIGCAKPQIQDSLNEEEYDFITKSYRGGVVLLDSSWLKSSLQVRENSLFAWYPIQNVELELLSPCDSCHAASANYFEFEHISYMRAHQKDVLFGVDSILELTPGIGDFSDVSPIDQIHKNLIKKIQSSVWSNEHLKLIDPFHGFYVYERLELLNDFLAEVRQRVSADYLWLPLQTKILLKPRNNQPEGEVHFLHHWILYDLKEDQVLIQVFQNLLWDSGNEEIDRNLSQLALKPMIGFHQSLQDSLPHWVE